MNEIEVTERDRVVKSRGHSTRDKSDRTHLMQDIREKEREIGRERETERETEREKERERERERGRK